MAKDAKSGLESELLDRQRGRARDEKPAPQSSSEKLMADLEAQRRKAAETAAKAPAATPASPVAPRTYTVAAGDSLSVIAKKVYGEAGRWKDIFEANKDVIKDPNVVRVGQELVIPE